MSKASVGIDCGSSACKGVLMRGGEIAAMCSRPTGWSPKESSRLVLDELLAIASMEAGSVKITATGYGRVGIDFADKSVTEITCHALGANFILPGVSTVIDIGGQDSKVISVRGGKVQSFQMNDKCAAGTGRFLEMSAIRMGVELADFPALLASGRSCSLSSMCAVFADSEIVSLLASGKTRQEIAGGIVQSVIARVMALAARVEVAPPILLTGGLSELEGLRFAMERRMEVAVAASRLSRFAGAIGAALK